MSNEFIDDAKTMGTEELIQYIADLKHDLHLCLNHAPFRLHGKWVYVPVSEFDRRVADDITQAIQYCESKTMGA